VLLPLLASAQQFTYDEYGFNRGLKNAAVNTILQDRGGYLWVGTMSGLFRGDGFEFREFGSGDGLPDGTIQDLIEDSSGALLVATRSGLAEKRAGRFLPVPLPEPVQVYGRNVLARDPAGRLYFATSRGLWIGQRSTNGLQFARFEGLNGAVDAVFVDSSARVWASAGRRLWRLNSDRRAAIPAPPGVPERRWDALIETSGGDLWVRSSQDLIVLPKNGSHFRPAGAGLPGSGFFGSLFVDSDGRLMVPTDDGLAYQTPGGWRLIGTEHGLPNDSVSVAFQDREGSLWLALWGSGLVRALGYGIVTNWTASDGLPNSTVAAIQRDLQGRLWAGTDRGLARLSEDGLSFRLWPGLASHKVRSIAMTAAGALWIGSFPGGVARVDPRSGAVNLPATPPGQPFDRVNALHVDEQDQLWVASIEGLFRTGPSPGPNPRFQRVDVPGAAPGEAYFRMARGAGGVLWVTSSQGLLRFDRHSVRRFTVAQGLRSAGLTHVAETPGGAVWVAYRDPVGITRLQFRDPGAPPRVTHYLENLASRSILLLRTDHEGRLWAGGDDGLDVFDGRSWARFRRSHGLATYSCAVNAFFAEPGGLIWIGTSRGLTRIGDARAALNPPRHQNLPVVTWVRFGEQKPEFEPTGSIQAGYHDRDFSVGMAALSFVDRESIRFRYRLTGKHDTWVETNEREARYAGLSPGDYTFELAVVPAPGMTPGPPTRLNFSILRPFWMTLWFQALVLVLFAALALVSIRLVLRWRMRALLAHKQELSDLVASRTRELEIEKARVAEERDRANAANGFKSEFIARMSHEVRTPVHGVVGMTDLLLLDDLKPEQREMLNVVQDSAGLLIKLLDDVLDLSRLEAGKHVLARAPFDLHLLAASVASLLRPAAAKKGLDLRLEYSASRRVFLGDGLKVRQILTNLASNAVKFTQSGFVVIQIRGGADGHPVEIEVADSGPGIPPGKIDLLFQPFVQLDPSVHTLHGGAGLGLSICQALTAVMNGTIRAESAPGQGARFVVQLPLPPAEMPQSSVETPEPPLDQAGAPLNVLVAEDNATNQMIVTRMLLALGHAVKVVGDGQEAVEEAAARDYDLILMDIRMPRMDGIEAARAIRRIGRKPDTPIVGLSANVLEADRIACIEAGMNGFLGKPLHLRELRERIAALLPRSAAGAAAGPRQ
jgi:signal transduction histidine kinase/ligand-binding sensor domain-containing protein/ActR/RegA family two-component response regulator